MANKTKKSNPALATNEQAPATLPPVQDDVKTNLTELMANTQASLKADKYNRSISAYAGSFAGESGQWTMIKTALAVKLELAGVELGLELGTRQMLVDQLKADCIDQLTYLKLDKVLSAAEFNTGKKTTQTYTALLKRALKNGIDYLPMGKNAVEDACKLAEKPVDVQDVDTTIVQDVDTTIVQDVDTTIVQDVDIDAIPQQAAVMLHDVKIAKHDTINPTTTPLQRLAVTHELPPAELARVNKTFNNLVNVLNERELHALTNRLVDFFTAMEHDTAVNE